MSNKEKQPFSGPTFVFGRKNYMLMLIGLAVILLGYILMIGGGSSDPNVFSEDLFSFQRTILSPVLIILGFVIEIIAILYRPKDQAETE